MNYRLIQVTYINKEEYKEEYRIQKNYGTIIPNWIDLIEETYKTKTEGLTALEIIKKNKTTKHLYKTIKVIK